MVDDSIDTPATARSKPGGRTASSPKPTDAGRAPGGIVLPESVVRAALQSRPLLGELCVIASGFVPKAAQPPPAPPASMAATSFLYCVQGAGWYEAEGRLHTVRAGDFLALPSLQPSCCRAHPQAPWTLHWVQAVGKRLPDYLRELLPHSSAPVIPVGEDPQLIRLFMEIHRTLQRGTSFIRLLPAAHALGYLLALVIQKRQEGPTEAGGTIQKVADAIISMSEHLDQPLPVPTLARQAGLSPAYFSELFKQQTGSSPREYLHLLRMHRACQLLQGTDWSMKRVANSLGYQDPFHFSRQFKAFQGVAPSQYRRTFSAI